MQSDTTVLLVIILSIFVGWSMNSIIGVDFNDPFSEQTETDEVIQFIKNQSETIENQSQIIDNQNSEIDELKSTDYYTKWQTAMNENQKIEDRTKTNYMIYILIVSITFILLIIFTWYLHHKDEKSLHADIKKLKLKYNDRTDQYQNLTTTINTTLTKKQQKKLYDKFRELNKEKTI